MDANKEEDFFAREGTENALVILQQKFSLLKFALKGQSIRKPEPQVWEQQYQKPYALKGRYPFFKP